MCLRISSQIKEEYVSTNPFSQEQKKFSICTPVYKDSYQYLEKFFTTLAEQEYKHFEVLVCFDGENPEGEKELNRLIKKFKKLDVRYCVQEWGGAPKARNTAASLATGDYLSFLDPDVYLYTDTLQIWANKLETNPDKDVVWGQYDILTHDNQKLTVGTSVPVSNGGEVQYYAFRSSNYCSGAFPIRKGAFIGWDETVKSLQDWDMWMRMLKQDNFEGKKFLYVAKPFFATEAPYEGGISDDSAKNWKERVKYIREKNDVPIPDVCVCSLGAPFHGVNAAKTLGADYLPMPSFKPNDYKLIYLLGFYTAKEAARAHMQVFEGFEGKKVIHWIGTDVIQMHWNCSFQKLRELRKWFKESKIVHLAEAQHTHDEMKEIDVDSKIIPLPPQKLYEPMPLPEEFTVAIYENETQNMYKEALMEEVALSMPDVKFVFFGDDTKKGREYRNVKHIGWADMDEVIATTSCNLRMTVHDGLPLTPLQYLTAGRQVICNTKLKGAIYCAPNRREIIEAIREAQKTTLNPEVGEYWRKECDKETFKKKIWGMI